jgi:hypothetical protein
MQPEVEVYELPKTRKLVSKGPKQIIEAEVARDGNTAEQLLDLVWGSHLTDHAMDNFQVAGLELLYTLKMSHRYLRNSPFFLKTMRDIQLMRWYLTKHEIAPELQEWFKKREEETYWYKHPDLTRDKKSFFTPKEVKYRYDHDSLHVAVASPGLPAYQSYAVEDHEVLSSKEKFFAASKEVRLHGVLEEAYVLALERSQIPYGVLSPNPLEGLTPRRSFDMALEKVCTSITSGWFREFAWENYDKVAVMYSDEYISKFNRGLAFGIIKPFKN